MSSIDGTNNNDSIDGTSGDDTINGLGGNDTLRGQAGADTMSGGEGNDSIFGDTGSDFVQGDAGDDTIDGGDGDDTLKGGSGADSIVGGAGDDTIYGGTGNDEMSGGDGSDTFIVEDNFGDDTITGGEGGSDVDTIDLSGLSSPVTITYNGTGRGTISNGSQTITFTEIERIVLTEQSDSVDAQVDTEGVAIDGLGGDDTIFGGSGDDTLDGGTGHDTVQGGIGNDNITGGDGNDSLSGGVGNDTVYGGTGDDTIDGGTGDDHLEGGDGSDTFMVSDNFGNDTIIGGEGGTDQDTIDLSALNGAVTIVYDGTGSGTITNGTDTITFSEIERFILTEHNDSVDASADQTGTIGDAEGVQIDARGGDDTIIGGRGGDTIQGGTGDDQIDSGYGHDSLDGGAGDDTLSGGLGDDTLIGGDGADSIDGGDENDSLEGGAGADTIFGGAGNDSIEGNDGNSGSDGDDVIDGGDGNDTISGDVGNDTLRGGTGDDAIEGAEGADSIEGGAGNDYLAGSDVNGLSSSAASGDLDPSTKNEDDASDTISGGDGDDSLFGNGGDDSLDGGSGSDWMRGGMGDDSMTGGSESDTVIGEEGRDTLFGGDGDDTVSGHEGDDALHGGTGNDSLYGGSGDDYFDGGTGSDEYNMHRSAGGGDNDLAETDRDVVRFEPGMGNDTAYDFEGENDFIYIGATPESEIITTQIDATTWRLTFDGNSADSLTLNFEPGTAPGDEGDLRNQLVDDSEYTPPQNGNPGFFTPSCFTPDTQILTIHGLHRIGSLRPGDMVVTADHGPQKIRQIIEHSFGPHVLKHQHSLRPVVIEAGSFGRGLPHRRLHVSRQHGFAALGGNALIRAAHLAEVCNIARIQKNRPNPVRYLHLVLDRHALVLVEGVWAETYFNNRLSKDVLPEPTRTGARSTPLHTLRCRPLLSRREVRHSDGITRDLGQVAPPSPRIVSDSLLENSPLHA